MFLEREPKREIKKKEFNPDTPKAKDKHLSAKGEKPERRFGKIRATVNFLTATAVGGTIIYGLHDVAKTFGYIKTIPYGDQGMYKHEPQHPGKITYIYKDTIIDLNATNTPVTHPEGSTNPPPPYETTWVRPTATATPSVEATADPEKLKIAATPIIDPQTLSPIVTGVDGQRVQFPPANPEGDKMRRAFQDPNTNDFSDIGKSTTSEEGIQQDFVRSGSPYAYLYITDKRGIKKSIAEYVYDDANYWHMNPGYFAAKMHFEDGGAGNSPLSQINNNPGNIRPKPGSNEPSYGGFRTYSTLAEGIDAMYQLLHDLYWKKWKLTNVDTIIPVYAPPDDNNNDVTYEAGMKQIMTQLWNDSSEAVEVQSKIVVRPTSYTPSEIRYLQNYILGKGKKAKK